jgi:hypothetical protein
VGGGLGLLTCRLSDCGEGSPGTSALRMACAMGSPLSQKTRVLPVVKGKGSVAIL